MTDKKRTAEERLFLAIGEIDGKFVKEAAEPYKPKLSLHRLGGIAASIVLVSVIALGAAKILPALAPAHGAAPPDYSEGDNTWTVTEETLYYDGSALRVNDIVGGRLQLTLDIYSPISNLVISIRGKDEEGRNIIFTTGEDAPEGYIKRELRINVNGIDTNTFPTDAGTYTVTVDLSDAQQADYEMEGEIDAGVFGMIAIEK